MPLLSKTQLGQFSTATRRSNPVAKSELHKSATKSRKSRRRFDIFLSHRFLDAASVLLLKHDLESFGYSVYVDWIESPELDRNKVTKETAAYLREVMDRSNSLLFAASAKSAASKWMPWELGYFDGSNGKVAIVPITERRTTSETYKGREYLGLYPYMTLAENKAGEDRLWINESADKYVLFEAWMAGAVPA